jgi:hypothetical protein
MRRIMRIGKRRLSEPTQREVLREVMLSAAECSTWLTLDELARPTHYPQTSISAHLRHLRKTANGAFVVEKRRREADEVAQHEAHGAVWEYRLRIGAPGPGGLRLRGGAAAERAYAVLRFFFGAGLRQSILGRKSDECETGAGV